MCPCHSATVFSNPKFHFLPQKNYWCGESETEFDEKFKNIDQDIIESDIYERNFGQNVAAIRIRKMNKVTFFCLSFCCCRIYSLKLIGFFFK